ncbi:MAG: hypothetical protein ABJK59_01605 [Erythrobacter sp.]|uniref:hypothetical protein n=1 Tax=Erythrobacter sp. TaxID=1042 RepID=UPI0032973C86
MIGTLAFLLAATAPSGEAELPVLKAFDRLCGESISTSEIEAKALGLGWSTHSPSEGSENAKLATELARVPSVEFNADLRIFQNEAGNLTVFGLEVVSPNKEAVLECKVIDSTKSKPNENELVSWAGAGPTKRRGSGPSEVLEWSPSHLPAPRVVAVYHVPLASESKWPGKGLIITSLRFYKIN